MVISLKNYNTKAEAKQTAVSKADRLDFPIQAGYRFRDSFVVSNTFANENYNVDQMVISIGTWGLGNINIDSFYRYFYNSSANICDCLGY